MPELPWIKWYPTNWMSEPGLMLCGPETRGIWIDALNVMMLSGKPYISGTIPELAQMCRCTPGGMQKAFASCKTYAICECKTDANGIFTMTSRKMCRDFSLREIRSNAARARWHKSDANDMQSSNANEHASSNANEHASSAYATAYASASPGVGAGEGKSDKSRPNRNGDTIEALALEAERCYAPDVHHASAGVLSNISDLLQAGHQPDRLRLVFAWLKEGGKYKPQHAMSLTDPGKFGGYAQQAMNPRNEDGSKKRKIRMEA
jgi:hypothetical protein